MYGIWIGIMAAYAFVLGSTLGGFGWIIAFGAFLFVVSDFIIGKTVIRGVHLQRAGDYIWLTYIIAQMGIVYGGII